MSQACCGLRDGQSVARVMDACGRWTTGRADGRVPTVSGGRLTSGEIEDGEAEVFGRSLGVGAWSIGPTWSPGLGLGEWFHGIGCRTRSPCDTLGRTEAGARDAARIDRCDPRHRDPGGSWSDGRQLVVVGAR